MPEAQRLLIRQAVERIHDIANNLLIKYRDEPQIDPEIARAELVASLLKTLLSEKRAQVNTAKVQLQLKVDEDCLGLFMKVNPTGFKRVISNLLNNAIEAIPAEGNVTVQLGKTGQMVSITINDTGVGIEPSVLEQIRNGGYKLQQG